MKNFSRIVLFCLLVFCFGNLAEAGLLGGRGGGGGGGLLGRLRGGGGSETEECPDGQCGLLSRFRGGDPQPTPAPPVEEYQPIQEIEASGMPPWAYLAFAMPAVLILGAAVGGGSYLITRKMQESE